MANSIPADSATFVFRFVGRFVFAEPVQRDGTIRALAIDPTFCRDIDAECHQVAVTVPSGCINPLGSCRPDLKVYSSASSDPKNDQPDRLEQWTWFLKNQEVHLQNPGLPGFTWGDDSKLLKFKRLAGSPLLSTTTATTPTGPTAAVIRLDCGVGTAISMTGELIDLQPLQTANQTSPGPGEVFADIVEIEVTAKFQPLILTLKGGGHPSAGCITLLPQEVTTVVSFSNLCNGASFENFDAEFASLYEALEHPPATRDRLVPVAVANLNARTDCHSPVAGSF